MYIIESEENILTQVYKLRFVQWNDFCVEKNNFIYVTPDASLQDGYLASTYERLIES